MRRNVGRGGGAKRWGQNDGGRERETSGIGFQLPNPEHAHLIILPRIILPSRLT